MVNKKFFQERITKTNDCWIWRLSVGTNGYGQMRFDGKVRSNAHRVSFIVHKGKIPKDSFVLHTCDNKKCVNPNHLYLGTQKQNVSDMIIRNRQFSYGRNLKFCKRGHEFTQNNTDIQILKNKQKTRRCKKCNALRAKKYRQKKGSKNGI